MRDNVARVRRILQEAVESKAAESAEVTARKAFTVYETNAPGLAAIEQSPKARSIREITRIATWYGWVNVVEQALDAVNASTLSQLAEDDLAALHQRMQQLVDCTNTGAGSPDAPPAS